MHVYAIESGSARPEWCRYKSASATGQSTLRVSLVALKHCHGQTDIVKRTIAEQFGRPTKPMALNHFRKVSHPRFDIECHTITRILRSSTAVTETKPRRASAHVSLPSDGVLTESTAAHCQVSIAISLSMIVLLVNPKAVLVDCCRNMPCQRSAYDGSCWVTHL